MPSCTAWWRTARIVSPARRTATASSPAIRGLFSAAGTGTASRRSRARMRAAPPTGRRATSPDFSPGFVARRRKTVTAGASSPSPNESTPPSHFASSKIDRVRPTPRPLCGVRAPRLGRGLARFPKLGNTALGTGTGQVIIRLKIDPELWSCPKCLGEQPRCLWRDTTLSTNDLVDALHGHANVVRQLHLRHTERDEKFFLQDFARMRGDSIRRDHWNLSCDSQLCALNVLRPPTIEIRCAIGH